ncbi:hypothetical protein NT239_03940 [Chitinibacter sp. SCUT-21]|uniref:hypothetical protein n=1 Tax=Chitinibacter sp. SCUT-21 TaxID=2970891 RepID=UPI0035A72879
MFLPEFSLPVRIPLRFFRTAPWWLALSALLLLTLDADQWQQRFAPPMLAITHLLALGFLGNIMLGALLQVSAVLTGVRAKHAPFWGMALWLVLQLGTAMLALGLWQMQPVLLQAAAAILFCGLISLALWLLHRFWRSGTRSVLSWPVIGLGLTAVSGTLLVGILSYGFPAIGLNEILRAHIVLASITWLIALIIAVAFTVVPMFLVAPAWPQALNRWLLPALLLCALAAVMDARGLTILCLPILAWLFGLLRLLQNSQRRADPARYLWGWGAVNMALVLALLPWLVDVSDTASILMAGHFVLAGVLPIITAMLAKIIPFLLWLDYRLQVPSGGKLRHMGQLFPERWLKRLAYLSIAMGITFWPLFQLTFKAIPIIILLYAGAIAYCLRRSVQTQQVAIVQAKTLSAQTSNQPK